MNDKAYISEIISTGHLVAIGSARDYYVGGKTIYSISNTLDNICVFGGLTTLNSHCHRLYQRLGYQYFTENPDIVVIDKDFFARFPWA